MKNIDVVREFLREREARTEHLKTDGHRLISYNTVIALRQDTGTEHVLVLNARKYSATTSKIQNMIRNEVQNSVYRLEEITEHEDLM